MPEQPLVECGGMPISILNYGKQMVLLLDDDGKRFLQDSMITVITQLSDECHASADAETQPREAEQVAAFRFDDSTPNVFGKVVWDTDCHGWKVTIGRGRDTRPRYKDNNGESLVVSEDLPGNAFERMKADRYKAAIACWNALDRSTRRRIPLPLDITIAGASSSVPPPVLVEESPEGHC